MRYYAYEYHQADTRPVGNEHEEIYGVELEIGNGNPLLSDILDDAISDNILTVPENEDQTQNMKVLEEDSSVWKEIILNADTIDELKARLLCLNEYDINPETVHNTAGTSCHIHINRNFLDAVGITERNLLRMFELMQPIIYRVSGRTQREFSRWANPHTRIKAGAINWERHAYEARQTNPNHNDRYYMVNFRNSETVEIRAFSNKCSFDYNTISFYLDFTQYLLKLCVNMLGKLYADEWENLIQSVKTWILTEYPEIYSAYGLHYVFNQAPKFSNLHDKAFNYLQDVAPRIREIENGNLYPPYIGYILWKYRKQLQRVTLTRAGLLNACEKVKTAHYCEMRANYQNAVYTVSHELLTGGA